MKKYYLNCVLVAVGLTMLVASCKREHNYGITNNKKATIDEKLVYRKPETQAEKQLVLNMEKVTTVLKDVYKDKEALKVVNAAIMAGIYTDQSILLKDLIYPTEGLLTTSKKFKELKSKLNLNEGKFSNAFWAGVGKLNDSQFSNFLSSIRPIGEEDSGMSKKASKMGISSTPNKPLVDEGGGNNDQIAIYFPFAEVYMNPYDNSGTYSPTTSVMTATADADEGYGWQPTFDGNGAINGYAVVIINDDYAYINPTHIIGINGIEPTNTDTSNPTSVFPPGAPIIVPGLPREVREVFVGEVRLKKQYDHLISFTRNGGGSEIRFTRSDGYLKLADGQVQADNFVIGVPTEITRYRIRTEQWVDWTVSWDGDWESDNEEQNLAVYEDDNASTVTKSFSLKTLLKIDSNLNGEGNIGGSIVYKSNDEIIHQQNYKWEVFFALNRGIPGDALQNGWRVYDSNSVFSFTLPDRKYTP